MHNRYAHVLSFALSHPWNLEPQMLSVVADILARRIAGQDTDRAEIEAALVNRKNLPQPRAGSIAVIPVYGVLAPRMNLMSEMSGGTTYDKLAVQLSEAMANKAVRTIVLDIDSPGGSVAGNAEFARQVLTARAKKPIVAVGQYTMASAAYHIASAATEIVAAPSARVGSIGTYAIHDDLSESLAKLGVKRTYISAGDGKVDGNNTEPLSEQARARAQSNINEYYGQFVSNVVKGRGQGMTADRVRDEWKAHLYTAQEALSLGMIDRIATLEETVSRLLSGSPDASDRVLAAETFLATDATAQEPATVTAQERESEIRWQNAIERDRALLELA